MPVTFFAHQAPLLPVVRRWPNAVDGVALAIGSMSPDFAYLLNGSRYQVWAHGFPGVALFCIPVTMLVTWIVVHLLAAVVPDHLPELGSFHLRDLRNLASRRSRLGKVVVWAEIGALSHVALDEFTHDWGWFAKHLSWYSRPLTGHLLFGREVTVFRLAQYIGDVGGVALCVWLLGRYGNDRWMADRNGRTPVLVTTTVSHAVLCLSTGVGLAVGALWVRADPNGSATDIIRLAATAFAGLVVGASVVRLTAERAASNALADER